MLARSLDLPCDTNVSAVRGQIMFYLYFINCCKLCLFLDLGLKKFVKNVASLFRIGGPKNLFLIQ